MQAQFARFTLHQQFVIQIVKPDQANCVALLFRIPHDEHEHVLILTAELILLLQQHWAHIRTLIQRKRQAALSNNVRPGQRPDELPVFH